MSTVFPHADTVSKITHISRRTLCLYCFALFIACFTTTVTAKQQEATATLSLQNALYIAEQRSQTLLAKEASAQASRELAIKASQLPDPTLQLSIDNIPFNGSSAYSLNEDFMTMRSIGIAQTYTSEAKRRAREKVFERSVDKANIAKSLSLTVVRKNTAQAWFASYYLQQIETLLIREKHEATLQVSAAEAAYRGGNGLQSDIFLARTAVAEIQDRIHQIQANLNNSKTTLERWVGNTTNVLLSDAPDITRTAFDTEHLYHQVIEHPDIALMMAEEAIVTAEAKAARQEKHADWTWSVMYSERGSNFSDMISIGVSVPLQWNQENRQDRVVAANLAKAQELRLEREEMTREHLAETERWLTTWKSNLMRLKDYEDTLIPLAKQRADAALSEYRGGTGELVDVLNARKIEITTRIEKLRIEMETADLWATLEYLTLPNTDTNHANADPIPTSNMMEPKE